MERIYNLFRAPATAGVILFIMTIIALLISNSALKYDYIYFITQKCSIGIGQYTLTKPMEIWVNEGLMAIFFFYIGLELKLEFIEGSLNNANAIVKPAIAAIGGMLLPAIIYLTIANNSYSAGWAIPTATDIAFAVGICSLLGKRVPNSFRIMLLSIAIFDDLGAVIIIALFYSDAISIYPLLLTAMILICLYWLNSRDVKNVFVYTLFGVILWIATVNSGIHATLSGFLLALFIPNSCLKPLEHKLKPWVAYFIMPIFALVNAGIDLSATSIVDLQHSVTVGIFFGLVLGKPIGIYIAGKAAGISDIKNSALLALGALCGVGFTMSLFIGTLAFEDLHAMNWVKLGVMLASLSMGITGYIALNIAYKENVNKIS